MSFDLAIWASETALSSSVAAETYAAVCNGDESRLMPSERVNALFEELTARFPGAASLDDTDADDTVPWSCWPLDKSDRHLLLAIQWPQVDRVVPIVLALASKHGLVCFDPQSGVVHNPPPVANVARRLTLADGTAVDGPSPEVTAAAVAAISEDNWFAYIESAPETYVQVGLGESAGVAQGHFALEWRDGSAQRHFRVVTTSKHDVVATFVGFLTDDGEWKRRHSWERLDI